MKITYYGHACFLIETQGKKLLLIHLFLKTPWQKKSILTKLKPTISCLLMAIKTMFWTLNKSLKIQEQHSFLTLKLSAGLETKESRDTE